MDDRRRIVAIEVPVDPGDEGAARGKRFDLHQAQDALPHLADHDVELLQERTDLLMRHARHEVDEPAVSFDVARCQRTPGQRSHVDSPGQCFNRGKDVLDPFHGIEPGEDQHFRHSGRGREAGRDAPHVDRVGEVDELFFVPLEKSLQVWGHVENRRCVREHRPCHPSIEGVVEVQVQVRAVSLREELPPRQHTHDSVREPVDMHDVVFPAPQAVDRG